MSSRSEPCPALVVFLLLQRHVTSGFAAGAVKG
jgi:N,N'-diacetylchitobiose transport system permease protein